MGLFSIGKMVMRSLFSKPATLMYPVVPRIPTPITRGHVSIDIEKCILCGMCKRKCPAQAIEVIRLEKSWEIDTYRCVQCNCCVEVCPVKCLKMEGSYTKPSTGLIKNKFIQAPKAEVKAEVKTEIKLEAKPEVMPEADA